jgi:hypothetical protein
MYLGEQEEQEQEEQEEHEEETGNRKNWVELPWVRLTIG